MNFILRFNRSSLKPNFGYPRWLKNLNFQGLATQDMENYKKVTKFLFFKKNIILIIGCPSAHFSAGQSRFYDESPF